MSAGRLWTRDELILAINLYCRTPFGKIHYRNPEIIDLARMLDRTPGSVSYKLANLASIDPTIHQKGASKGSKLDREVWDEFMADWDGMAFKSEEAYRQLMGENAATELPLGEDCLALTRRRVNQGFFRKMILSSYNNVCCISGLQHPELLVASHIVPWSVDAANRTNPSNGLCLNRLHDRAFDVGLITVGEDYSVVVSPQLSGYDDEGSVFLTRFSGKTIRLPDRFLPDQAFLEYHRTAIFKSA